MDIFLSWDSDDLNRKVKRLSLSDDAAQIKQVYQAVDRANALWHSWVESIGGEIVSMDGDCGRATIPATRLSELPNIREQYSDAIGSPLSVGVATKLSQADRALLVAKKRGGDQVVLYTQEVEHELAPKPADDADAVVDQLAQSQIKKAESPALWEGDENAGMSGAKRPSAPAAPMHGAPEHSQGEAMRNMMADENPGRPEMTHAARDFEEFFHQEAEKQEKEDNGHRDSAKQGDPNDGIKKQVAQVLEQVRSQAQTLEAIKSQAPQVYQAVMGMVKAVIAMARALPEDVQEKPQQDDKQEQVQKSEQPIAFEQPLQKSIKDIPMGKQVKASSLPASMQMVLKRSRAIAPNFKAFDYSHALSAALQASGYRMFVFSNDSDKVNPDSAYSHTISAFVFHPNEKEDGGIVGGVSGRVDPFEHKGTTKPAINIGYASVSKNHRRRGLGQTAYEAVMAHAMREFKVKLAAGDWHSSSASATHSRLAEKHGFKYRAEPNFGPGTAYPNEKEWSEAKNQSFDNKFGAYAYTLKSEQLTKGGEQQPDPELLRRIAEIVSTTKASAWSRVKAAGNVQDFNRFVEHWGNPQYEDEDVTGSQVVVAPNPHVGANAERQAEGDREYKPWRATYIDKDGAPTGHSEHDSYEEALNAAAFWGGADLFSKPLGAMRKDEEYRADWYEPLNKAEKIIAKLGGKRELDPSEEPIGGNKLDKEEFDPEELKMGIEEEMEHTDDPKESEKITKDHLREDPKYYSKLKAAFAKGLPMPDPKKPTHHHLELPPGSQKDHSPQATREVGKVKVKHGDGKEGWVEVRAGQVLSADGHAISSRNKGGK